MKLRSLRAGALAVTAAGVLLVPASIASAQEPSAPTCEDRCATLEEACYERCEQATDPDSCESACGDEADACFDRCLE